MAPVAVVVGPPGAGKSTVGRLLAARLGVGFRDTDTDVEALAGKPIAEVFLDEGEAHFRELERRAVTTALAEHDGVLALGGGAVLDPQTRAALRPYTVVSLTVELPDAARRIGFNRDRPLLVGNPRAQWKALMEARRPLYEEVATVTVATDGRRPQAVAEQVAQELEERR